MIYTDSGKYAIRAITYLASCPEELLPVSAADVAESESIPPYYLAKVLQDLARVGILESVRGRGGGFLLKNPPDEIRVMDVLRAVENTNRLTEDCVLGIAECNDEVPCPMHETWQEFRAALLSRLENMTVTDLVEEMERKRAHLSNS
jgi:Rrf2 family protein